MSRSKYSLHLMLTRIFILETQKLLRGFEGTVPWQIWVGMLPFYQGILAAVKDRLPLSLARSPAPPGSPTGANTSRGDMGDRRTVPVIKELTGLGKQMGVLAITVQRRWMQDNAARGSLRDSSLAWSQGWFWKILMIVCRVVSQVRAWESCLGWASALQVIVKVKPFGV